MNNNKEFLATEPIGKLLLRLAIPTLAAQMINMLYNIIDRIYIGHIPGSGALALTGVGVCMPLIMIISAFAALVGNGGAPRASILMGKKDLDSAENILGKAISSIVVAVMRKFVLLIPLIYIMPHIFTTDQTMAVYMAEPVADFIAVTFTAILFSVQFKKALAAIRLS